MAQELFIAVRFNGGDAAINIKDRTHRSLGPGPMARLCKKLGLVGFGALPEYVSYTTPQLLVELAGLVVELGWP